MMMSSGNLMNATVSRHPLSVIVCTHNRAEVLGPALESLARQQLRNEIPYEVIVVDNASTDDTPSVVAKYERIKARPQMQRIVERNLGLSYARNAGLKSALGDIIVFLDDDAIAEPTWLQELFNTYIEYPTSWAVGGRSIPITEEPHPVWFRGKMLRFLGGHDYGPKVLKLSKRMSLQGANMSFRRLAFDTIGDFSLKLGRKGKKQLSHEDVEFCFRLMKSGKEIYYNPKALIQHCFPRQRLSINDLSLTRFHGGQSEAIVDQMYFGRLFTAAKSFKKVMLTLFVYPLLIIWNRLRSKEDKAYYYLVYSYATFGYVLQTLCQLLKPYQYK